MKTLRPTYRGANEIRYADPDAFQNTVNQSVRTQPKKAGSRTVYNVNGTLNAQRTATLPAALNTSAVDQERLAIRFSVSGSTLSKQEFKKFLADFRTWMVAVEDDWVDGFLSDANLLVNDETAPEA